MSLDMSQIPDSLRKPGKYFEFSTTLASRNLPANRQKVLIVGQRRAKSVSAADLRGSGLDDLTPAGTYTGTDLKKFVVEIDAEGTPDTFKWSDDGGVTWTAETVAVTGAAQALANGVTVAFGATTGHTDGDQWIFYAHPEPTVAEEVPTAIYSDVEAAHLFGYGSQVHLMAKAAIRANPYLALTVCALDDEAAAVAASGSVAIAAAAGAAGTLTLWVGNQSVVIALASGDTAAAIADSLCDQIMAQPDLPVTAASAAGTLTLTAKNKGTQGNSINLSYEVTNSATSATITAMSSGAADPDIDDALDQVVADQFDILVSAWNDSSNLADLSTHLDTVSGPLEQRPGIGVYGYAGTLSAATTLAVGVNSGRVLCAFLRSTRSLPLEVAAAMASMLAFEEDPARPLNTLELKKIHAPDLTDRLTRTEQKTCLYNGVTPLTVDSAQAVRIVRAISTYVKDPQGVDDPSLLDITTIRTLDYVRKAVRDRVALRFPRSKLSSRTAAQVKSEIYDVLKRLEALEIVEAVDDNFDGLVVEVNAIDANRLDAKIPTDVVNGLHVLAGRIDLLL